MAHAAAAGKLRERKTAYRSAKRWFLAEAAREGQAASPHNIMILF